MKPIQPLCVLFLWAFSLVLIFARLSLAVAESPYQMEDNAIRHFHQGQTWMEVDQYDAAIKEYQIAIRLKPSTTMTAALYNDLGMAYLKAREFSRAIVSFQQAISLNSNFSLYYENLVKAYQAAGALSVATREIAQTTQANPEDTPAWYLLGLLHQTNGNPSSATQAFETYLRLAPYAMLADAAKLNLQRIQYTSCIREGVSPPTAKRDLLTPKAFP